MKIGTVHAFEMFPSALNIAASPPSFIYPPINIDNHYVNTLVKRAHEYLSIYLHT